MNDGLTYTNASITQPSATRACAALLVAMEALDMTDGARWVRKVAGEHAAQHKGADALREALATYSGLLRRTARADV